MPKMCVSRGRLWNRGSVDVVCRAATDVRLEVGACGIERLDVEWLVLMWCAATDIRLEWVLVESSV